MIEYFNINQYEYQIYWMKTWEVLKKKIIAQGQNRRIRERDSHWPHASSRGFWTKEKKKYKPNTVLLQQTKYGMWLDEETNYYA